MGHYVIRLSSTPELDGELAQAGLSVTGDDGRSREARVLLDGLSLDPGSWAGALTSAAEQIEVGFKGETWGVEVEDVAPLLIKVDEATAARVAGEGRAQSSLEVGAVVGEFDI
jgi:hypothetical protein